MIPSSSDERSSDSNSENEMYNVRMREPPKKLTKSAKHVSETEGHSSQSDVEVRPPPKAKKTTKNPAKTSKPSQNSDSESDIELRSKLPRKKPKLLKTHTHDELLIERTAEKQKNVKDVKSKDPKKTTKEMVHQALEDLKTRKGVSGYAIKKYVIENYSVDQNKIGFYIKKYIKNSVENGALIQVKGIGVSGSFKLPPMKKKSEKKVKIAKEGVEKKSEKTNMEKVKPKLKAKSSEDASESKKIMKQKPEKKMANKSTKPATLKTTKEKAMKKDEGEVKVSKKQPKKPEDAKKPIKKTKKETKMVSDKDTGNVAKKVAKEIKKKSKRKSIVRRKSIGTLVKPPKMKPKSRA